MFRIDVAGLDETASLLGAPAGVRLVHEPALVVHEVVQVAPRSGESLAKSLTADRQHLRPDDVGDLEDLAQDVDHALLTIETEQHAGRAPDPGFVDQKPYIGRDAALVRQVEVGSVVETVTVTAEGDRRRFPAAALRVEHVV